MVLDLATSQHITLPKLHTMAVRTPPVVLRRATPADYRAIGKLFSGGMRRTISSGLREAMIDTGLKWAFPIAVMGMVHCLTAFAGIGEAYHVWWSTVWGMSVLCLILVGALGYGVAVLVVPRREANKYVRRAVGEDYLGGKSLKTVLQAETFSAAQRDASGSLRTCAVWVATIDDVVVGTVGVEAVKGGGGSGGGGSSSGGGKGEGKGEGARASSPAEWTGWGAGDAELRRMSVSPTAQGKGVGKALFNTLRRHCLEQNQGGGHLVRAGEGTEQVYRRVVLSTSEMQTSACFGLYPRLGFDEVHRTVMRRYGQLRTQRDSLLHSHSLLHSLLHTRRMHG